MTFISLSYFKTELYKIEPNIYSFSCGVVSRFLMVTLSNVFNRVFFKECRLQLLYCFFSWEFTLTIETLFTRESSSVIFFFLATPQYYIKIKCPELSYIILKYRFLSWECVCHSSYCEPSFWTLFCHLQDSG